MTKEKLRKISKKHAKDKSKTKLSKKIFSAAMVSGLLLTDATVIGKVTVGAATKDAQAVITRMIEDVEAPPAETGEFENIMPDTDKAEITENDAKTTFDVTQFVDMPATDSLFIGPRIESEDWRDIYGAYDFPVVTVKEVSRSNGTITFYIEKFTGVGNLNSFDFWEVKVFIGSQEYTVRASSNQSQETTISITGLPEEVSGEAQIYFRQTQTGNDNSFQLKGQGGGGTVTIPEVNPVNVNVVPGAAAKTYDGTTAFTNETSFDKATISVEMSDGHKIVVDIDDEDFIKEHFIFDSANAGTARKLMPKNAASAATIWEMIANELQNEALTSDDIDKISRQIQLDELFTATIFPQTALTPDNFTAAARGGIKKVADGSDKVNNDGEISRPSVIFDEEREIFLNFDKNWLQYADSQVHSDRDAIIVAPENGFTQAQLREIFGLDDSFSFADTDAMTAWLTGTPISTDTGSATLFASTITSDSINIDGMNITTSHISRTYNGTTSIDITAVTAPTIEINGETFELDMSNLTLRYDDKNAADEVGILVEGTIRFDGSENYDLSTISPSDLFTGEITKRPLKLHKGVVHNKIFDGTTNIAVDGIDSISFSDLVKGESVSFDGNENELEFSDEMTNLHSDDQFDLAYEAKQLADATWTLSPADNTNLDNYLVLLESSVLPENFSSPLAHSKQMIMRAVSTSTDGFSYNVNDLFDVGDITPEDGAHLVLEENETPESTTTSIIATLNLDYHMENNTIHPDHKDEIEDAGVTYELYADNPTTAGATDMSPLATNETGIFTELTPNTTYYVLASTNASQNFHSGPKTQIMTLSTMGSVTPLPIPQMPGTTYPDVEPAPMPQFPGVGNSGGGNSTENGGGSGGSSSTESGGGSGGSNNVKPKPSPTRPSGSNNTRNGGTSTDSAKNGNTGRNGGSTDFGSKDDSSNKGNLSNAKDADNTRKSGNNDFSEESFIDSKNSDSEQPKNTGNVSLASTSKALPALGEEVSRLATLLGATALAVGTFLVAFKRRRRPTNKK